MKQYRAIIHASGETTAIYLDASSEDIARIAAVAIVQQIPTLARIDLFAASGKDYTPKAFLSFRTAESWIVPA
jgi:hypothetical protein